jgi:hypothetical protein
MISESSLLFTRAGHRKGVQANRKLRWLAVLAALMLLASACGGDDADTGDGGDAGGEEIDLAAFCEGAIEGEAVFTRGPETDEEGNPAEGSLEQLKSDIEPHIEAIEQNTPQEIESEVDAVLEAVRSALETGDQESTQNPEFLEAETVLDEYVFENCEFDNQQEFAAVDYAYEAVPASLSAGRVAFRMDNRGDEVHEAVFFKIAEGEQRSMQELLALPEEQVEQVAEFQGVTFAPPGTQGYAVVDLEAGRYSMVCFIPVGTESLDELGPPEGGESPGATSSPTGTASSPAASPTGASPTAAASPTSTASPGAAGEGEGEEGPTPHFRRGMVAEFTVS